MPNGQSTSPEISPDGWSVPPETVELFPDEVHVWRCALDVSDGEIARMERTLASDEREKAAYFRFFWDRNRFIAGRGTLRAILAQYSNRKPEQLRFLYGPYGKPRLAGEPDREGIRFNLAHSRGLALYAFARGREVGIDVEFVRPELGGEEIARRFFSPVELAGLAGHSETARPEAFFRCWTSKEAYLKARGEGLSFPLDQFTVSTSLEGEDRLLAAPEPAEMLSWSLRRLTPAEGYVGTLAVEGGGWRAKFWKGAD
ncbi:MAG: 4'-phosphopantetheinyl transferase family protein [Thermoanaerobaculia bacterium]